MHESMFIQTHTYMNAYIHTYKHVCTLHTNIHICMHAYIHTYMYACIHTYIQNVSPGNMPFKQGIQMLKNRYGFKMKIFVTFSYHLIGISIVFTYTCMHDLKSYWDI